MLASKPSSQLESNLNRFVNPQSDSAYLHPALAGLVKNIVDGQLSKDKTIMAGVGKDDDGFFTFTALKK